MLDTSRTIAERRRLAWFEDHRRVGLGHFYTPEDLEKLHVVDLGQAMSGMASAMVQRGLGNQAAVSSSRRRRLIRPGDPGFRSACYSAVWLDGARVYRGKNGEPLFDVNQIAIEDIVGVEFYAGPAEIPSEYSSLDMDCGVLVIWTRR